MDNKKPPKKGRVKYLDRATRMDAYLYDEAAREARRRDEAAREASRIRSTRAAEHDASFKKRVDNESDLWKDEFDP